MSDETQYPVKGETLVDVDTLVGMYHTAERQIAELESTAMRKNDSMGSMVREIGELRVELANMTAAHDSECRQAWRYERERDALRKRLDDAERARDLEREERERLQARIDAMLSRLESLKLAIGNATYLDECMFSVDALQRMLDHIRDAGQEAK